MRQVIVDTETTGLRIEQGHRIIEVGCLEMVNRKLTGKHFHRYINPEREVEAGALAVHGISNEFLQDKPPFAAIAQELLDFMKDAELIIHNAPFDLSFLDYELSSALRGFKKTTDYCRIIDTLQVARQLHVGQRNSLDALCKRYKIDNSKRDFHGALLDAHLLAQVYLAMTGGQGSFFDDMREDVLQVDTIFVEMANPITPSNYKLKVLFADTTELKAHQEYLNLLKKQGNCLWPDE